jgi:hypothetical protein
VYWYCGLMEKRHGPQLAELSSIERMPDWLEIVADLSKEGGASFTVSNGGPEDAHKESKGNMKTT